MKYDQSKVQNTWHGICQLLWGGKALGTASIKRGILPCEFLKCHTRILVTAVLAGNQKKENILGDSMTEREKQNDLTSIHERDTHTFFINYRAKRQCSYCVVLHLETSLMPMFSNNRATNNKAKTL